MKWKILKIMNEERKEEKVGQMKAILFDVDDTLYDQAQPTAAAYHLISQKPIDMGELLLVNTKYSCILFEKMRRQEAPLEELYIERAKNNMSEFGIAISDEEARLYQERYIQAQKEIYVSETMKAILDYCVEKGIFLGIITNGLSDHQREKIDILKLDRWIKKEHMLVSSDIGLEKPDKRLFDWAKEHMGLGELEPEDILYIGDSFDKDIVGAKGAGWKAIWYNRRNMAPTREDIIPDYIVRTDEELFELIRELEVA